MVACRAEVPQGCSSVQNICVWDERANIRLGLGPEMGLPILNLKASLWIKLGGSEVSLQNLIHNLQS